MLLEIENAMRVWQIGVSIKYINIPISLINLYIFPSNPKAKRYIIKKICLNELKTKKGWGHSSIEQGLKFAEDLDLINSF